MKTTLYLLNKYCSTGSSHGVRRTLGRVQVVNELFELSLAHKYCRSQGERFACKVVDWRSSCLKDLRQEPLLDQDERPLLGVALHQLHRPENREIKIFILSARLLFPMFTWGVASIGLGVFANQMPLTFLLMVTWGSFRWNENELLAAFSGFFNEDSEEGVFFRNHPGYYGVFVSLVICSYLFVCFYMRNSVSDVIRARISEHLHPYTNQVQHLYYRLFFEVFSKTQESMIDHLEGPIQTQFIDHMESFKGALEKGDLEALQSIERAMTSLIADTPERSLARQERNSF